MLIGKWSMEQPQWNKQSFVMQEIRLRGAITAPNKLTAHWIRSMRGRQFPGWGHWTINPQSHISYGLCAGITHTYTHTQGERRHFRAPASLELHSIQQKNCGCTAYQTFKIKMYVTGFLNWMIPRCHIDTIVSSPAFHKMIRTQSQLDNNILMSHMF